MSTTVAPTHVPCSGPSSRSQQSSSSRFQQLLQAKIAAEKVDPTTTPLPPPAQAPVNQAFNHLSTVDTVFNPSFMGQHYQQAPPTFEGKDQDIPAEEISAAFRSVTTERIASMFADTQDQARQDWGMQEANMYPPQVPIKQESTESYHQNPLATPLQSRPANMSAHPDYALWRERVGRSPQSVGSTPSMMDSTSSLGLPVTPLLAHTAQVGHRHSIDSIKSSPSSAPLQYGMTAFNMNGQIQVPGISQASTNEGDSLNLNNLGGDGSNGYDQGGYGGDNGGYGGGDDYGDNGSGGYGPPGGNGAGGSGGDGNDPGEGPPPPPKGKKLQLACHFCRRRKLKCDGIRPECSNCNKRGENCIFDDSVRRRGPGKRTKDMRGRSGHDIQGHNEGNFSAYVLNDPSHMPLGGPSHETHHSTPDLEQMAAAASAANQQHYHETNMPSGNLPEIDPNIDPALAILGMGIDAGPSNSPIPPATLAEADPTRGQKRKSDLNGEEDGKRLKLEDETYEGTLPSADLGGEVGDIPGFASWAGEGREEEVNEEDLEKFENDLRRVIQDQAEAEIEAMGTEHPL